MNKVCGYLLRIIGVMSIRQPSADSHNRRYETNPHIRRPRKGSCFKSRARHCFILLDFLASICFIDTATRRWSSRFGIHAYRAKGAIAQDAAALTRSIAVRLAGQTMGTNEVVRFVLKANPKYCSLNGVSSHHHLAQVIDECAHFSRQELSAEIDHVKI